MSDKDAREEALESLRLAQQTIAGWAEESDGRVHIHKDVISKAVNAAIVNLESQRTQAPSEQSAEEFWPKWTGPKWMGSSDFQTVGLITVFAFAEAYAKSLAGTQAQAAQWISVEEKLPEPQIWVIGCCLHDGKRVVSPVYGRTAGTPPEFRFESEFTVIYWQPLPVAPVAALEGNGEKK